MKKCLAIIMVVGTGFMTCRQGATKSASRFLVLGFILASLLVAPLKAVSTPWVSGFYVGYGSSAYPPSAIEFSSLTHVMVFSVLPNSNGTLDTTLFIDAVNGPRVAQEVASRAHAAGRKAILVVGGANTAAQFRSATSPTYMNTFVQNLVTTMTSWGFDGIDIDWEPLPSSDYAAILSLISNLRNASPGLIITADVGWVNNNFPLSPTEAQFYAQLAGAVDQMNIMTYDMADNWSGWVSWHSSALYGEGANHPSSVHSSVLQYLNAGVPASKLGIGIGFYGSCWNAPVTAPLQSPGSSHVVASDNTMGFANIMNQYFSSQHYFYDETAKAPFLSFSSATGPAGCTFVSYEDEVSVAAKGQYVQQQGLGGTIIWQLNEGYNPSAPNPSSLLHAVGAAFLTGTDPTTTSLSSSVQSAIFGQPITFTAVVTSTAGVPDGSVTFRDGTTTLGTASLSAGRATWTTSTLAVGTHSVTATYSGSPTYAASTSAVLSATINPALTTTALTSSMNPTVYGQSIQFTAVVAALAPGAGTPTGTVIFTDTTTSTILGTKTLASGTAQLSVANLPAGSHMIVASYGGATSYTASVSSSLGQTVNAAATRVTLTSSKNPVRKGQTVTFTAKIAAVAPGAGTPTGTVRFYDGSTLIGSVTTSNGSASLPTSTLSSGIHSITATYGGSSHYLGSTSLVLKQTVK